MPIVRLGGVVDFKLQARIMQEFESRMTQMQEGEDDVDISAPNITTPMAHQGQKCRITSDRAYMPNSQVNSFIDVHTYSS
jgi:hypothetical protein